jgi:hypothetical protein
MANKSARRKKSSRANLNKRTHQRAKRRTRNKGEHAPQLTNYLLEPHPEL